MYCIRLYCVESNMHLQGRSQELEMGGAKLLGEGSGGRLSPPVGQGKALLGGPGGQSPPEALGF